MTHKLLTTTSLLIVAALLTAACEDDQIIPRIRNERTPEDFDGQTDSITHWVDSCSNDDQCDEDSACYCGICTRLCDDDTTCQEPNSTRNATCVSQSSDAYRAQCGVADSQLGGLCMETCTTAQDCSVSGSTCSGDGVCVLPCLQDQDLWSPDTDTMTLFSSPNGEGRVFALENRGTYENLVVRSCFLPDTERIFTQYEYNHIALHSAEGGAFVGLELNAVPVDGLSEVCTRWTSLYGTENWYSQAPLNLEVRYIEPLECEDRWSAKCTPNDDEPCGECWYGVFQTIQRTCQNTFRE